MDGGEVWRLGGGWVGARQASEVGASEGILQDGRNTERVREQQEKKTGHKHSVFK